MPCGSYQEFLKWGVQHPADLHTHAQTNALTASVQMLEIISCKNFESRWLVDLYHHQAGRQQEVLYLSNISSSYTYITSTNATENTRALTKEEK